MHLKIASLSIAALLALLSGCGIPGGSYLRIGGAARPEYAPSPLPLREKAARFEERLLRHLSPEGVNIYILHGDRSAAEEMEGGDFRLADCAIWTGAILGAECLRLSVTGDPEAREKVRRLTEGLHALHEVTGIRGHFARSFARRDAPSPGERGIWYPGAGGWATYRWKGDTSKDQYAGVIFGLGLAASLADDPDVRALAASDARALADHLIEHEFQIVGPDGKVTRYGDLSGCIFGVPIGVNALIALAAMKVAAATGEPRYEEVYRDLVRRGYARAAYWAKFQILGRTNGNNDVMALLSLFNLLLLERDPVIRAQYVASCRRFRKYVRHDGNSFFNFIIAWALAGDPDLEEDGRLTLRLFPMEKRNYSTDSSSRTDLERAFFNGWRGRPQAIYPLPVNYRPQSTWVWRDNPRQLASLARREGMENAAPTDYLTAYWLGRYLGFIGPED